MLQKRGQVTYFILLGVILLFVVVLFLFFTKEDVMDDFVPDKEIPVEFQTVHNYVQECFEESMLRATLLLGSQGGFITIPKRIELNRKSYLPLTPAGDLKLPLWYYQGENRVPTIGFMQEQMDDYVTNRMSECLEGLQGSGFINQFDFSFPKPMKTETKILDKAVWGEFTYPIRVTQKSSDLQIEFSKFSNRLDVKLKKIYDLGQAIMRAEDDELFLEQLTIELMTLGSGSPPEGIPFTDMLFTCERPQWSRKAVLNTLKNRLYYNLPRVQVKNTARPLPGRDDPYATHHFVWNVTEDSYKDIDMGLLFHKEWPFDFSVTPSHGDVMSSSFGRGPREYLRYMCVNAYHFTYTMRYPVVITLTDKEAFGGDGFVFRFALPVLIDHNQGERRAFDQSVFQAPERDREVCKDLEKEPYTIYALDNITGAFINNVNVSFDCVNRFSCPLGKTGSDAGVSRLTALLPTFCTPGSVVLEHPDYVYTKKQLDREQDTVDVELLPVKHLPLRVMKRTFRVDQFQDLEELYPGEKALVFISTNDVADFGKVGRYPLDDAKLEDAPEAAQLSSMDIIVTDDVTYDFSIALLDKEDEIIGRLEGNWTPTQEEVAAATELHITAVEYVPHPQTNIGQAKMIDDLTKPQVYGQVLPQLVSN